MGCVPILLLDFTTYKGLKSVVIEKLPGIYTRLIRNYTERITGLAQKLTGIEEEIGTVSNLDHDMVNLMSIPGVGHFSAALIKSEIIDIARFASFNRLCAYVGLAPRVSASANKTSWSIKHQPEEESPMDTVGKCVSIY